MRRYSSLLRRRSEHVRWPLIDQALVSGSNFLIGVLLIRVFDLDVYGIYVLLWAAVQFAQSIQNALLIAPMTSIGPAVALQEQRDYFHSVMTWLGLWAAVSAMLVIAVSGLLEGLLPHWWRTDYTYPLALWVFSAQVQDGLRRILLVRTSYRRAFLVDLLAYAGQLFVVLAASRVDYGATPIIWLISLSHLASAGLAAAWLCVRPASWAGLRNTWRRHWTSSRWLLGAALFQWLSGNLILLTAAGIHGPAFTGAIRAAQNIFGVTHVVFQALENVVPARATSAFVANGIVGLKSYLNNVAAWVFSGTLFLAVPVAFLAEWVLGFVYGKVSDISIAAIYWYVPIYLIIAIGLPLRTALRTLERTWAIFAGYGVGAVCAFLFSAAAVLSSGVNTVMAGILIVQLFTLVPIAVSVISQARAPVPI